MYLKWFLQERDLYTIRKNSSTEEEATFGENGKWVLIHYLRVAHFLGQNGKHKCDL
jgi:hypothetical protein